MEDNFGLLLHESDIKLHRQYFQQMVKLLGIKVVYRAPKPGKHYTSFTEIETNYENPSIIGCIFQEHPSQSTMKKLGWVSEVQTESSLINVPYDTPGIQVGGLFIVPSGIDNTKGRLFRVVNMEVGIVYPASITCEIVPEWEDDFSITKETIARREFSLLSTEEMKNV